MKEYDDVNSLDFKMMYSQLIKEKKGYKSELQAILISSTSLEFSIHNLLDLQIKELDSKSLEDWAKNRFIPISAKLRLLRVSDIISENLYKNIRILFDIRNQFAHNFWPTAEMRDEFYNELEKFVIGNNFVSELPNNSIKFQLLSSQCFKELFDASEKIDPESVQKLVLDEEFTLIDEEKT